MRTLLQTLCLTTLLSGCGGSTEPGPEADEGKTPAQVEEQAKAADVPALEAIVSRYQGAIAELKTEHADLEQKLEQLSKQVGDSLLGGAGKTEELQAQMTALKGEVEALFAELKQLKGRLDIYTIELASRAKAG